MNILKKQRRLLRYLIIMAIFSLMVFYPTHEVGKEYVWAEQGSDVEYKAITYNIHHGKTKNGEASIQQMVSLLKKEEADFIALQEVDRYSIRSGLNDQINIFANELEMYYVFEPNINIGVLQYGNGILSKYPILESGKITLPSSKEPRSILWAKVMTEKGNIYLTSIHLGLAQNERINYFKAIEKFMNEIATDHPVLIMGDFNTLPTNDALAHLQFRVTEKLYKREIPTYQHQEKEIQIDYIMGKGIREGFSYSIPNKASDHYPLVMKFKIDQNIKNKSGLPNLF